VERGKPGVLHPAIMPAAPDLGAPLVQIRCGWHNGGMQNTRLAALDHDLGPEIDMLRTSVRDFADEKIAPIAAELDKTDRLPIDLWPRSEEHTAELQSLA